MDCLKEITKKKLNNGYMIIKEGDMTILKTANALAALQKIQGNTALCFLYRKEVD